MIVVSRKRRRGTAAHMRTIEIESDGGVIFSFVILVFFVPEGHRILAVGKTHRYRMQRELAPGRAPDRSLGLSPFQGWKSFGAYIPVVSPPANLLRRLRRRRAFS